MSIRDDEYEPRRDETHDHGCWRERGGTSRDFARQFDRLIDWLRDRPAESWAFFAAGAVLATILF